MAIKRKSKTRTIKRRRRHRINHTGLYTVHTVYVDIIYTLGGGEPGPLSGLIGRVHFLLVEELLGASNIFAHVQ